MTNLGPDFWGPHAWKFIHIVALAYPVNPTQQEKNNYRQFYTIIGDIIPCHFCRDHYKEHIKKNPITDDILSNRKNLLHWTIDIHNEVNKITGKNVYDYDTAVQLIQQDTNQPTNINNNTNQSANTSNINTNQSANTSNINTNHPTNTSNINTNHPTNTNNNIKYIILFVLIVIIIMFLYYDTRKKTI